MPVTIYRAAPDTGVFQELRTDDAEFLKKSTFNGDPIEGPWRAPKLYIPDTTKPEPDIWGCFGNPSIFAISPQLADDALRGFIDESCEEFPLRIRSREWRLINVVNVVDCLDADRSRFDPAAPAHVTDYEFLPIFSGWLWKIPQTCRTEVLTPEGMAARHDEFKGTVEKLKLTGLRFERLWRGEGPP
ncbi:MAG TPA: hypothetical protein VFE47_25525 [Tepidisphaeraceae bacterium]|jgi:hypothetical protein|nr:hypothetical protein [Tepidisphaeraceae bacterium]